MRRPRTRPIALAMAVLAGIAMLATAASAGAASTKKVELHVVQWNIEGAHDTSLTQIPAIVKTFQHRPDVFFIEEVCQSEVQHMRDLSYFKGWHFVFKASQQAPKCPKATGEPKASSHSLGQVIASPHAMSRQTDYRLPGKTHKGEKSASGTPAPDRKFYLTCADLAFGGVRAHSVRACGTHLRPGFNASYEFTERDNESAKIRAITDGFRSAGQQIVLGGDFNAVPTTSTMSAIYQLDNAGTDAGAGHFVEADQNDSQYFHLDPTCTSKYHCRSGAPTQPAANHKIDYVFYTAGAVDVAGAPGAAVKSDHRALFSTATLTLPKG